MTISAQKIAVIDLGSNAVRLVVFNGIRRAPLQLHNERILARLGRGLSETGKLNPDGVKMALDALARFKGMIDMMNIKQVFGVATAAVRDASDGRAFLDKVKNDLGLDIRVIDGEEEARLSALGVMSGRMQASGIIGDMGGGSLELIAVEDGKILDRVSFPIGPLRLGGLKGQAARKRAILGHIENSEFIKKHKSKPFIALGGSWRSLGRAHMNIYDHGIYVLDRYEIKGKDAIEFALGVSRKSVPVLEKMAGLSRRRVNDMPIAALAMAEIFTALKVKTVSFSNTGLREGLIYDQLTPSDKKKDPLLSFCSGIAHSANRFDDAEILMQWTDGLFPNETEQLTRLRKAGCLMSDFGWIEHEDYRAEHAYRRILHFPFLGIKHDERAYLALTLYTRYKGYVRDVKRSPDDVTAVAQNVLRPASVKNAVNLGLYLRLAYILTGGVLGLLADTELKRTNKTLTLVLRGRAKALKGGVIEEVLGILADRLKLKPVLQLKD